MNIEHLRPIIERWLHEQWQHRGVWAWLTAPLAVLFGFVLTIRSWFVTRFAQHQVRKIRTPIIVVGNIYIGGTGKTPVVIALVQQLRALGWHPGVISRGYGTKIGSLPLLGQGLVDAKIFGDEPALITQETNAPIAVHPDRFQACIDLLLTFPHVNVVVSDDGLQHLRLPRDLEIIVQDTRGVGNGWLLPAGPLREPISRLNKTHALLTRVDDAPLIERKSSLLANIYRSASVQRHTSFFLEIYQFRHLLSGRRHEPARFIADVKHLSVSALAGIAQPERFFTSLRKMGIKLSQTHALADHFAFDQFSFCECPNNIILMTEKDAIKCHHFKDHRLWVAEVKLVFADSEFLPWLNTQLHTKASRFHSH